MMRKGDGLGRSMSMRNNLNKNIADAFGLGVEDLPPISSSPSSNTNSDSNS